MNKKIVLTLVMGIFLMGIASAVVVNYLSQNATATITVGMPLVNELSKDGTTWQKDIVTVSYDGNPVSIYLKTKNELTTDVLGTPNDRITGTNITCEDFDVDVTGSRDAINITCVNVGNLNTILTLDVRGLSPFTFVGSQTYEYNISILFAPGAMGTYIFQSQVMV